MSELILGLAAIFLQGIFSGSETAFTRANWIRLATWQKQPTIASLLKLRAESTLRLLEQKERVLIITLIFTNLFVVSASVIFSRFFIVHFGPAYTSIAVLVVVMLSLIFGDFLPKALAQAFPEYWVIIASPLIELLLMIMNFFRPKNKTKKFHELSRQDFLYLLQEQKSGTSLVTNQMAKALFDFSRLSVYEIMVPKERIIAFSENADLKIIKKTIEKYRFSRYPVYQKDNHNIIGIIHIKDILIAMRKKGFQINDMIRAPYRVLNQAKAMPVLKAMSRQGEHMAIVEDENGATIGIITLEDLLEEIVGEIRSET
jgi:putative hemolysin